MKIIEPSYVWNGTLSKRTQPIYRIILHHAAASHCSAVQVHSWHKARGWVGIGYHFFITKDGDIYRGRPLDCIGAHAGGYNYDSIGICFEGNFENEVMQNAQEEAGRALVKSLTAQYKTIKLIQRHSDVNATACPGKNFPFDYIAHGIVPDSDPKEEAVYGINVAEIARGATGPDVLILQKMLIGNGFSCGRTKADGQFGANTEQAVKDFQKSRSILVDGIAGKQTWYKLFLKEDTHGS